MEAPVTLSHKAQSREMVKSGRCLDPVWRVRESEWIAMRSTTDKHWKADAYQYLTSRWLTFGTMMAKAKPVVDTSMVDGDRKKCLVGALTSSRLLGGSKGDAIRSSKNPLKSQQMVGR